MWESKRKLQKTCLLNVLRRKTLKTDTNQPISRSRKTLPKMYILSVFELVTYKKKKKLIQSTLYWETKGHCEKSV